MKLKMKNIPLWWKFEGQYYWSDLKNGIKNLIKWFPVIWKDRNYDHAFIIDILKTKLEIQSNVIAKSDRHTRALQDARHMMICVKLLDKLKDGFYSMEPYDYQESNFRFEKIIDKEGYSELFIDHVSENLDEYFKIYPLIYKRVINNGLVNDGTPDRKKEIAREMSNINYERGKELLFKILKERIEYWWI